MGCDYKADDEGTFELEIWDYQGHGGKLGSVVIHGLEPKHELYVLIPRGSAR